MVSLDQVLLLQEKVEAAVEKIVSLESKIQESEAKNQELTRENDALRSKCVELTNALSQKTELVSTLEATQSKIETSILNALNKLDAVENTVLSSSINNIINSSNVIEEDLDDSESNISISARDLNTSSKGPAIPVKIIEPDYESDITVAVPQENTSEENAVLKTSDDSIKSEAVKNSEESLSNNSDSIDSLNSIEEPVIDFSDDITDDISEENTDDPANQLEIF